MPWDDCRYQRSGGLATWVEQADARLDADVRLRLEQTEEIAHAIAAVKALPVLYRAAGGTCVPHGSHPAWFRATAAAVLPWVRGFYAAAAILLENARRERAGDPDSVVQPALPRTTPYGSYRAALSAAFSVHAPVLGGHGVARLGGAQAAPLPSGMVFGQIAVSPSASHGAGRARGEDAILSHVAAWKAVEAARVGKGPERRPLSSVELEILRLCDVGLDRGKAKRVQGSIVPAIDPLDVQSAVTYLLERRVSGAPRTEREGSAALRRARKAVIAALSERRLIPEPKPRRRP